MGFGCNAAAIVSTRIIESPRERMIAILTNNFVPCNGRWPILITLSILFVGGAVAAGWGTAASTAVVVGFVLIGVMVTLAVSWGFSRTMLKGIPSSFTLELPLIAGPRWDGPLSAPSMIGPSTFSGGPSAWPHPPVQSPG